MLWRAAPVSSGILAIGLCLVLIPACAQPTDPPPVPGPSKLRALLVGINDYSASRLGDGAAGASLRSTWPSLAGAVNDAEAVRAILETAFGFEREDILLLTDQDATRDAIFQAIEKHLIEPAEEGDTVVFYYSGHGSQVLNSKSDERDQLDESIVPADVPVGAPDIRDKELRLRFNRILDRGARLVVAFDSCHSGSAARGLISGASPRRVEPDRRDVADSSDYGPKPEERGALVLSASQDDELAWEVSTDKGKVHGAFTWALLKAMRSAAEDESAERVFLRARAWLRSTRKYQEPVLAGRPEDIRRPLFGGRADQRDGKIVVVVESTAEDGTVVLRGGWANGLAVGSELLKLAAGPRPGPRPRLEVVEVEGLGRSTARIVERRSGSSVTGSPQEVATGDLFELVSWVAPQGAVLRAWIPTVADTAAARRLANGLHELASRGQFHWIDDPVAESDEQTPIQVLRWHGEQWQLHARVDGSEPLSLGAAPSPPEVAAHLPTDAGLFVHLPAPVSLGEAIEIGPETRHRAVEPIDDPAAADYHLVGRLRGEEIEYAWIRPETDDADERRSGMPSRTAWHDSEESALPLAAVADRLQRHVLRLAKIHGWHELQTPPNQGFPYRLRLRDEGDARLIDAAGLRQEAEELREGRRYTAVLELRPDAAASGSGVRQRYVYFFSIDNAGNSILLYPPTPWGNIENRFPPTSGTAPAEIAIGEDSAFDVIAPFGTDTFFLLTTAEPILNPLVLEYDGVRGRGPKGGSALEELLSLTGGIRATRRSMVTSMRWSLEKQVYRTLPDHTQGDG